MRFDMLGSEDATGPRADLQYYSLAVFPSLSTPKSDPVLAESWEVRYEWADAGKRPIRGPE